MSHYITTLVVINLSNLAIYLQFSTRVEADTLINVQTFTLFCRSQDSFVKMSTSIVKTNSGPVKGISKQTELGKLYHSFQHIPYVEQPKGDLRFRDPQPVKPWTETLDCTEEGSPAYSFDMFLPDGPKVVGSDDCLGVNVFTPNVSTDKITCFLHFLRKTKNLLYY